MSDMLSVSESRSSLRLSDNGSCSPPTPLEVRSFDLLGMERGISGETLFRLDWPPFRSNVKPYHLQGLDLDAVEDVETSTLARMRQSLLSRADLDVGISKYLLSDLRTHEDESTVDISAVYENLLFGYGGDARERQSPSISTGKHPRVPYQSQIAPGQLPCSNELATRNTLRNILYFTESRRHFPRSILSRTELVML